MKNSTREFAEKQCDENRKRMDKEKENCGKCRFFKGDGGCTGCCGKHAPAFKEVTCGHNRVWPDVRYDEWCGDFELKGT